MTTRRERLEVRVEKREEWAEKAAARGEARHAEARRIMNGIPLGQPILVGHHSERRARRDVARIDASMTKGFEEQKLAEHHERKAEGLARQLESNVFGDDPDAIERLEARIAERIAAGERARAINKAWRRGMANAPPGAPRSEQLEAAAGHVVGNGLMTEAEVADAVRRMTLATWLRSPFSTTGVAAGARADRERIEQIRRQRERAERAKALPSGVLVEGDAWVRVTFPEKPSREVLAALRAAGFRWGGGSWCGERARLPAGIVQEATA